MSLSGDDLKLPEIGTRESQTLDFKARANYSTLAERLELAKDVVALANAAGGRLIIGASGGDELTGWAPMTEAVAQQVCSGYEVACRDLCVPGPMFSCQPVKRGADQHAVVVVVRPQVGPVIGVAIKLEEDASAKTTFGAEVAYRFPVRVGTHTKYFNPSNLPVTEERRIGALLAQLSEGDPLKLRAPSRFGGIDERDVVFVAVDPTMAELLTRATNGTVFKPIPLFDIHNVLPLRAQSPAKVIYKDSARIHLA